MRNELTNKTSNQDQDNENYEDGYISLLLKNVFEQIPIPMILVDKYENVISLNKAYTNYLHVDEKEYLGRNIRNFISNTRIPIVMKTKKAELANHHIYTDGPASGQEAIVHRIPIVYDDKVIGCFGMVMFQNIEELMLLAAENKRIKDELNYYKKELKKYKDAKYEIDNILGSSDAVIKMKNEILKLANTKTTILIQGESGTGKELVAHSLHNCSQRKDSPFIRLNCAAIPENLAESEFFGYEGGTFTGSNKKGSLGSFELANSGTIFLDEIGELPMFMQAKLLRVLQEKEITRIGGHKTIPIDVRVIAATNKDLDEMVIEGKFREDLFFRLNILDIKVPPLRERITDIRDLCSFFLDKIFTENGVHKTITNDVFVVFEKYPWHGNIRELSNVLEKMYFNSNNSIIDLKDLPPKILGNIKVSYNQYEKNGLDMMIKKIESDTVSLIMEKTNNNVSKVAEILKISRPRIYRILNKEH